MSNYEAWSPKSLEEAQWMIDTGNAGVAFWKWGEDRARELAPLAGPKSGAVLDYGCGVGRVLKHFPQKELYGVDVSPEMLSLAREWSFGPTYLLGDGKSIPLPDASITFAYSLLTFQHMDVSDVCEVVRDIYRLLKPGGKVWLQFSDFGESFELMATLKRTASPWHGERAGLGWDAHATVRWDKMNVQCAMGGTWDEVTFEHTQHGGGPAFWIAKGVK